ncbi:MAG: HAMP domain-containing histidine kinase [Acidobacteria bacterium]|nr:HAMP domain-containing histidine kinase [Acidobacteriota bacterium]MBV9477735.1 HAMP domain-containing histidine kinase [Acidobacteriota bacterium]
MTIHPVLDTAPCGYVSVADDGTMLEVNLTLASMLGYTRAELLGWHLQKILPPGGRIFYQTHVFPLLKMHGIAEELYVALRTRDGNDIPTLLNAARRERDGQRVTDCIFVRMLQRHEFEDQLLQARRLAESANEAKAKFLSMMSHDIRTPLTAIAGYAGLAAGGAFGPLNDEQRAAMQGIRGACDELLRLMNDILGFAQLDSGRIPVHPVPLRAREVIARAETLVRLRAEESGLTLRTDTCDDDLVVRADPERLQQILLNLLTNAIKFTPHGGAIEITCEPHDARVCIRVRDTGIGIPREQLERIFDPFVQLDPIVDVVHRGVGLGLAISRDLARAMGGELRAESTPGSGSVFTIELPAADAAVNALLEQETTS